MSISAIGLHFFGHNNQFWVEHYWPLDIGLQMEVKRAPVCVQCVLPMWRDTSIMFCLLFDFPFQRASACYLIKSSFNCLPTLNGQIVIWNYHLLRLLLTIYRLIYLPAKSNWIVSFGIESEHKTRGNNKKTTKIPNESRFGYRISTLFAHQAVLLVFYGSYVFVCVS